MYLRQKRVQIGPLHRRDRTSTATAAACTMKIFAGHPAAALWGPRFWLGGTMGHLRVAEGGDVMDTVWMADGKCRELPPETFFPSDGVGVDAARRICADCPVKMECLEYAMANHIDHGVWGGTSERERRRMARQRRHLTLHKAH